MKRFIQSIFIILLSCQWAYAQEDSDGMSDFAESRKHSLFSEGLPLPNSPEASSMMQYSSPQSNLYRGEVSIEIPFYTYSDDDFEIPISFSYRSGGYRPNVPYGVMGLGWSLNAGGFISREVRGVVDEASPPSNKDLYKFVNKLYGDNDRYVAFPEPDMYGYSYWFKADSTDNKGYYHLDCVLDFKAGAEFMPTLSPNVDSDDAFYKHIETTPDVFQFTVPGHNGSFVFDSHGKAIFFDTSGAAAFYELDATFSGSLITSFTITTDDRYIYHFDVLEKSASYNTRGSEDNQFITNTWKLSSIEAPNGRRVEYSYGPDYWTDALVPFKVEEDYKRELRSVRDHMDGVPIDGVSRFEDLDTQNQFPTCNTVINYPLTGITVDGKIGFAFDYSAQSLRKGSSYKGRNLSRISVIDLHANDTTRFCRFSYHTDGHKGETYSSSHLGVTFLDSLILSENGAYVFEYDEPTSGMPPTDTYAIDWYGFYNGATTASYFLPAMSDAKEGDSFLLTMRQPSKIHSQYGMLKKLTYPTGGWTQFTYEQNTYSKDHLNTSCRLNLQPDGRDYCGAGVRLKSMSDYSGVGEEFRRTDYSYVNRDGLSSGCLLWRPVIYSNYSVRTTNILDLDRETISSANDFTYSGLPHIEYLRVVEEVYDPAAPQHKGITEYTYHTSYHIDARDNYDVGVGMDIHDWEYNISTLENHRHTPWVQSNEQSRIGGRLLTRTTYSDDMSKPIMKDSISYEIHYPDGVTSLEAYTVQMGFPSKLFYSFASVIQDSKSECAYDEEGRVISCKLSEKNYDSSGRFIGTTHTDSRGRTVETMLSYHNDIPTLVTKVVTKVDGVVVRADKYHYTHLGGSRYPDLFVPSYMEQAVITSATTDDGALEYKPKITFDEYDSKGHLLQSTDERGTKTAYVWGYGGLYPIAAVEGISHTQLGLSSVYQGGLSAANESYLRSLSGVSATTWEHDPLVGVTKCTDPSGRIYTYSYDDHNRLAESALNGNTVLMQYIYNIVSQNNNLIQP